MSEYGGRYNDSYGPGTGGKKNKSGGAYHRRTGADRFDDRSDDYLKYNSRGRGDTGTDKFRFGFQDHDGYDEYDGYDGYNDFDDYGQYDEFVDYIDYDDYGGSDGGYNSGYDGGYDGEASRERYSDRDREERMPGRDNGYGKRRNGAKRNGRQDFDDYYDQDYDGFPGGKNGRPAQKKKRPQRSGHGNNLLRRGRQNRTVTIAVAVILCAVAAAAGIFYAAVLRVRSPLEVSSALAQIEDGTVSVLLRSSVNDRLSTRTVNVSVNGLTYALSLADCEFRLSDDPDGTVHKETERVSVNGTEQEVRVTYMTRGSVRFNATKILDFLHGISGSGAVRMIEPDYYVDIRQDRNTKEYSGKLIIKAGTDGYGIDFETFIGELLTRIYNDDYPPINSTLAVTHAPAVDIESIYNDVHAKPADAYTKNDGKGNVTYEPEVVGVDFNKRSAADKIASGGSEWVIDLAVTMPKVTRKALMAETFPDLLATYSTRFVASNEARSSNLALAGEYINGTILQPGDVFSFNGTVGERTKERGFQKATVYSAEGTDEDYGGGICQTSSTLFYCAMKANLQAVERKNHRYTVAYMVDESGNVCYGNDATVNWGLADMKFSNSKEYPIKIECVTKSGVITFNIWGTWDGYTAEYTYREKDIKDYQMMYKPIDPEKKDHAGQKGRTVTTYRHIFYQAEPDVGEREEIESAKEFVSIYYPMTKVMYVDAPPEGFEFNVLYDLSAQPSTTTSTSTTTAALPGGDPTEAGTEATQPGTEAAQPNG